MTFPLRQILFYKELDFTPTNTLVTLEDPAFDPIQTLESHKLVLQAQPYRLTTLPTSIDKTIATLKDERIIQTNNELYEGFLQG